MSEAASPRASRTPSWPAWLGPETRSLAGVLSALARQPGRGITFVGDNEQSVRVEYAELARKAVALAWCLPVQAGAGEGAPVAVLSSDCEVQVSCFWSAACAGRVASILPPPSLLVTPAYYRATVPQMLAALRPACVVTDRQTLPRLQQLLPPEALPADRLVLWEELLAGESPTAAAAVADLDGRERVLEPEAAVYVQFSSGASGTPKGVVLQNRAVLANVAAMIERLEAGPDDVGISWLPLYHDMGLLGGHLVPAFCAMEHTLMRPMGFLARPQSWLARASATRATMAVAPSFAYDLVVARTRPEQYPSDFSLAPMRAMLNGSEPVRAAGVAGFLETFAPAGLRPDVMVPCYGLAEATLAVTICPPGREPVLSRAAPEGWGATSGEGQSVACVSVGPPLSGVELMLLGEDERPAPAGGPGEILVRGASLMRGYLRSESGEAFWEDAGGRRWLRTGDLGFLEGGNLFVTGRLKDVIIVRGRNHDPADLEAAAETVEGVRPGHTAAFSYVDGASGAERVVLLAETAPDAPPEVTRRIAERVSERTGVVLDQVELVARGHVQRTTSGKKIRYPLKQQFLRQGRPSR